MHDVGEDVGDLHDPIMPLRDVGRCLDDDRLAAEIDKRDAIKRVIVRRHDDALEAADSRRCSRSR